MPKVSVLMPAYNSEQYLARAIDSIVSQSFTDWELILVNDGSTDRSEDIALSYSDDRIRYSKNDGNKGLIYTRNLMIEKASGEYIAFLDSDDMAMPDRLRLQIDFLDNNPDFALCGTWSSIIDDRGNTVGKINMPNKDEDARSSLLFVNSFVQSSIMIRRQILVDHPYDKDYPLAEDYELWCRLSKSYKIKNIPVRLTQYRWHEMNISKSRNELLCSLAQKIHARELKAIGIDASAAELSLHSAISNKSMQECGDNEFFELLKDWLRKVSKAAIESKKYDNSSMQATILFRWIFACKERKKYIKALSFPIIPDLGTFKKLILMLRNRL